MNELDSEGFTGFLCEQCHTEIEASLDMVGQETECPACGARIVVPAPGGDEQLVRHRAGDLSFLQDQAVKSRTIRIELGDL